MLMNKYNSFYKKETKKLIKEFWKYLKFDFWKKAKNIRIHKVDFYTENSLKNAWYTTFWVVILVTKQSWIKTFLFWLKECENITNQKVVSDNDLKVLKKEYINFNLIEQLIDDLAYKWEKTYKKIFNYVTK